MRSHPLLRAYMAGIVVPTLFLLVVVGILMSHRYYFEVPNQYVIPLVGEPLRRGIVFPMAIVPNAWGAWNMLYVLFASRRRLSVGLFGALLPVVLMPAGVVWAHAFDPFTIQWRFAIPMVPIAMIVYYLAWKYLVRYLNEEVGVGAV